VPPLGGLYHVCDGCGGSTPLSLDLADWPESTGGEGFLELTGDTVIGVVVRSKRGEDDLPELVPLMLGGNSSRGRGSAVQVVDVEINDANFRRGANGVSSLSRETNDIGTGIIDINFGVTSVNGREGDTVPATKFNNILDGHNRNLFGLEVS